MSRVSIAKLALLCTLFVAGVQSQHRVPRSVVEPNEAFWISDQVLNLQPIPITDVDLQWVQVIGEGWANPLVGPMTEQEVNTTTKLPIVLSVSAHSKMLIERARAANRDVSLVSRAGQPVAVLGSAVVFPFRKDAFSSKVWGHFEANHPYLKEVIAPSAEFLVSGELLQIRKLKFNDGLDKYRLTPAELIEKLNQNGRSAYVAFQGDGALHRGHSNLINTAAQRIESSINSKPMTWISPVGGWSKAEIPIDVRLRQHEEMISEGFFDSANTVLSLWPSPRTYSGRTEMNWHFESRKNAGADFSIIEHTAASISYSNDYHRFHSPSSIIAHPEVEIRPLSEFGFMGAKPWAVMHEFYMNRENPTYMEKVVFQSKMLPEVAQQTIVAAPSEMGLVGSHYSVYLTNSTNGKVSPWHDIPLMSGGNYNMVVEFPMGSNAKMEVQKDLPHNPIKQDTKHGLPRYYTYSLPVFNYGLFPQTWEDSSLKDSAGNFGDNDPLDVMEIGGIPFPTGSVVPVKVLGSLALIDSGETDNKIIAIALSNPDADRINNIDDLERVKGPGFGDRLRNWLKYYKTTSKSNPDTATPNDFLEGGLYQSVQRSIEVINHTQRRWEVLRAGQVNHSNPAAIADFWLGL